MPNKAVKLDDATYDRLKALGESRQRTPHWLMKTAIEEYIEREEAYEREKQEDMERWQLYQATGHAIPHEQVAEWLDSIANGQPLPCPK